jgi:hypothetical protein
MIPYGGDMRYSGILWIAIMLIAGCTSAVPAEGAGANDITFDIQGKTYDEVWSAIESVSGQSLTITERNKAAGILKATRGVVMGPWGNDVEFSVRPAHNGAPEYLVELESTKQRASRLPTEDWANTMEYKIKAELGQ